MQFDLKDFIKNALLEDIGDGDHSSLASIPKNTQNKAILKIKADGIIAGIDVAVQVFEMVDKNLTIQILKKDGDVIKNGEIAFEVSGNAISILTAERLVLNFMQRMSGIATYTHFLTQKIKHTHCQLLDTRKTTPGFRYFEKLAVKIGGGQNHRFGLYDMIMLKDNHIDFAGGIENAIKSTHQYLKSNNKNLKIEIETRSIDDVKKVLEIGGIDRIMLDNFPPSEMKKAVELINNRFETEASGGITENNIVEYAETGVNFISVGALTHQIKSLDLSLKAVQ